MEIQYCIHEKEFMCKGYTFRYGLDNNCGFKSTDLERCKKCLEFAKSKSKMFFNNLDKIDK